MNNRLLVIGLIGISVSVVCLTVGGVQISRLAVGKDGGTLLSRLAELGIGEDDCPVDDGPQDSRSVTWNGGDRVEVSLPANVHYKPGSGNQLVVHGDKAVLSHLQLRDGNIRLDCRYRDGRLDVTLPGREFRTFALNGSGHLELQDIDQHELNLRLAGSGDVEGNGKVDRLEIGIAGASDVRLGALAAQDVGVHIAGSGNVEIAPHRNLNVNVAGAGKVILKSEPQHIENHFAGSGRIIHDPALEQGDDKQAAPPMPDKPRMPDMPETKKG